MLRLSIIVPLYNSEKYLPKCLDSLLCQDIPEQEYEIILVDDGSPDGSRRVAEDYQSRHSNIIVLTQSNKGTSGARNTGIGQAVGRYLCFVDPDDYILKNSFAILLRKMEEDNLDVLRFGYSEVNEQYQLTKSCKNPEVPDYSSEVMDGVTYMAERLGVACYVWTYLFRTSLLKDNGIFFYEGDYYDDTPWLPRVLSMARRVDSIDFKRYFYLIRENSLVQSSNKTSITRKIEGQRFLIKNLLRQKRTLNNNLASRWYDMMIAHCTLTLLTLVGQYSYADKKQYLQELKESDVIPLSTSRGSRKNRLKFFFINLSPKLFCLLIHLKN